MSGTMGVAILSGILASLDSDTTDAAQLPPRLPSRFIVTVRSSPSVQKLEKAFSSYRSPVNIVQATKPEHNVSACSDAQIIILGCKPYMVKDILSAPGMKEALASKLLISICAGVSVEQLEESIYGEGESSGDYDAEGNNIFGYCRCIRAMPNTASIIRQSMTVLSAPTPALPAADQLLVEWIFSQIGKIVTLPASAM